ncbi:MAG: head GIN domain-containing protein [Bacteroidota bacterium]
MKKSLLTILLISFLSNAIAQSTERRDVGDYDQVSVSGWFDVTLVEGTEGEITLEGKSSQLKYIDTEVRDGRLKIEWTKRTNINPFYSFSKVYITVPVEDIDAVYLSGSGSVIGEKALNADRFSAKLSGSGKIELDLVTEKINTAISGSGDIILSGKTTDLDVEVSGSGDVKAFGLEADFVAASISGSADVNVNAKEKIWARISGSGDVNYIGSPDKIDSKISGSGSVSKGKNNM